MALSSSQARRMALLLHASRDSRQHTEPARAAFLSRFEREVDPGGILPSEERARRAQLARRAYFIELAEKSAKKRAERKNKRDGRS